MARRAGCVLGWATAALVVVACSADPASEQRPGGSGGAPSGSTAVQEPPAATGSPAPRRGEPGFDALPKCFGARATILGAAGDDQIVGTSRVDVIVTLGGNDQVSGLRHNDTVCTGSGNDTVTDVDHYGITIDLAGGNDRATGLAGLAEVHAGAGDDLLTISAAAATGVGLGPGDDSLRVLLDGRQHDPYNTPCPYFRAALRPMRVNLLRGWARGQGHDRLFNVHCVLAGRFGDKVVGSADADDIDVGGGNNRVWSLGGKDVVYTNTGHGDDVFYLGAGNDSAMSGMGADRVLGGSGNDFVEASYGPDHLYGGGGNDALHASYRCDFGSSAGAGTVDRFPNQVFGGLGYDYLTGDLGVDHLDGGPGADRGQGGYRDGQVDWIESVEKIVSC